MQEVQTKLKLLREGQMFSNCAPVMTHSYMLVTELAAINASEKKKKAKEAMETQLSLPEKLADYMDSAGHKKKKMEAITELEDDLRKSADKLRWVWRRIGKGLGKRN